MIPRTLSVSSRIAKSALARRLMFSAIRSLSSMNSPAGDGKANNDQKDSQGDYERVSNDTLSSAMNLAKARIAANRNAKPTDPSARHQGAGTVVRLTDDGPIVLSQQKGSGEKLSGVSTDHIEDANDENTPVQITGFGGGAIGVNNAFFHGSVAILPNMSFLWSPTSWGEVTVESLEFLRLLHPLPDLLLFGCGPVPKPVPASVNRFLTELRIPFELQSTPHACGTFNILNEEKRRVVACLVTLTSEEHAIYQQKGESRFLRKGLFNYED